MPLSFALGRDDAALQTPVFAAVEYALTAGAATDAVWRTAAVLDLQQQFGTRRFGSLTAVVTASAVLAEDQALALAGHFELSADGLTWADVSDPVDLLALGGPGTAAGTHTGAAVLGCRLADAERYVRLAYKPDLSAADTDTAKVNVAYVLTSPTEL